MNYAKDVTKNSLITTWTPNVKQMQLQFGRILREIEDQGAEGSNFTLNFEK